MDGDFDAVIRPQLGRVVAQRERDGPLSIRSSGQRRCTSAEVRAK